MPKGQKFEWTPEMHEFCRVRAKMTRRELTQAFNAKFGTNRTIDNIKAFCLRNGYKTGRTGKFLPGQSSWNLGRTGVCAPGCAATHFKKGHKPNNAQPVGTEIKMPPRPGKDPGYWRVKVAEPRQWKFKHRLIWENAHGPVPAGYAVIFKDCDPNNCVLSNLALVTKGEIAILNHVYRWKHVPDEERETVLLMARIDYITGRLERGEDINTTENSLRALAEAHGVNYATVCARITNQGMTVQQALRAG